MKEGIGLAGEEWFKWGIPDHGGMGCVNTPTGTQTAQQNHSTIF